MEKPDRWWIWLGWSIAVWIIPACMLAIWGSCYTEVFGEPPCDPWAKVAMDGLFTLNFAMVALSLFMARNQPNCFDFAALVGFGETVVATLIWFWGGMSVSGFYF